MAKKSLSPQGFGSASPDELKFLQRHLLEHVLEFDEICRKHNITYYLDGGSVIGAVRHRGFVPWDDDIDILMKQTEWERFLAIIDEELAARPGRLLSFSGRKQNHHRTYARFVRTDVPLVQKPTMVDANYKPGIFLDIFILDGVPAKHLAAHQQQLESSEVWYHKRYFGVNGRAILSEYRRYNALERIFGSEWLQRHFIKQMTRWEDQKADFYTPRSGWNYAVYSADVFQEPKYLEFEGHMLPVPTKPEKYLRAHYGLRWYMLPPLGNRSFTHYLFTSTTHSSDDFLNEYNWLKYHDKIVKSKERGYVLRIKRKPYWNRVAQLKSQMRLTAAELDLSHRLSAESARELAKKNASIELVETGRRFIASALELVKVGADLGRRPICNQDVIESLIFALVLEGRPDDAAKLTALYPSESGKTESLVDAVNQLDAALQDGLLDEAGRIVDEFLPRYPDVPSLVVASATLHPGDYGSRELAVLLDRLQDRVQNLDALRSLYGHALKHEGDEAQAHRVLSALTSSENGLVALAATDVVPAEVVAGIEDAAPAEDDSDELEPSADAGDPDETQQTRELTKVQQHQLQLLTEINELCEARSIPYSLGGFAAIDYIRNGALTRRDGHVLHVLFTPESFKRFRTIGAERLPGDRKIIKSKAPADHGQETWFYADESTLFFNPFDVDEQVHNIHVELVVLARAGADSTDRAASKRWVHTIPEVNAAEFSYAPGRIDDTVIIETNGVRTQIFAELLEQPADVLSAFESLSLHSFRPTRQFSSRYVGYTDFRAYVPDDMLAEIREANNKQLHWLCRIQQYDRRGRYAVDRQARKVAFHLHQLKLRDSFTATADTLRALRKADDWEGIAAYLKEYRTLFRFFFDFGYVMVPTEESFNALIELFREEGREKYPNAILARRANPFTYSREIVNGLRRRVKRIVRLGR